MKKIRLNYLTFFALAAFLISGCAGLSKMRDDAGTVSYQVKPNPLVMKAGQVSVTGDVNFPEKYFNKKAVVVATPVLKYEGGQTELPTVTLQGEKVEANNKVIPYAGGSASFSGTVPYKPEMANSELVVNYSARIKEGDPVEYGSEKIADGVVATEALVRVDPQTIALSDNFKRIIPETYTADIHYVINQADVRRNELRSDDIKDFESKLEAANADSSWQNKELPHDSVIWDH